MKGGEQRGGSGLTEVGISVGGLTPTESNRSTGQLTNSAVDPRHSVEMLAAICSVDKMSAMSPAFAYRPRTRVLDGHVGLPIRVSRQEHHVPAAASDSRQAHVSRIESLHVVSASDASPTCLKCNKILILYFVALEYIRQCNTDQPHSNSSSFRTGLGTGCTRTACVPKSEIVFYVPNPDPLRMHTIRNGSPATSAQVTRVF
ncbi:hypothetical protein B0H14DRAFT_3176494 [Mycena olivaceomarginata]|nr:hypothetical protein B0H14DRAFT_3176494 [Mycena olivaceomarginata]